MKSLIKKIGVIVSSIILTANALAAGFSGGICYADGAQFSSLSPLQAVVTDSLKNLISLPYSANTGTNSLVSRDGDGFTALDGLKVGEIQSLNPFDPDTRISIGSPLQFNNYVFFPGLDPLKLIATDGANQVESIAYRSENEPSTVVFRDADQSFGINNINVDTALTLNNGVALRTDTTNAHTALIQARNTNTNTYVTFGTLTNGAVPALQFTRPSGTGMTWNGGPIGNVTPSTGAFTALSSTSLSVNSFAFTVNGAPTLNDWFDQSVKTTSTPTFNNLYVTNDLYARVYHSFDGTQPTFLVNDGSNTGNNAVTVQSVAGGVLLQPAAGRDVTVLTSAGGKIGAGLINSSTLTASQAVVTDSSKNLTSLAYSQSATASNLAQRDGSGNLAGNITGNAATVTTNANLTGPITSSGNATAIASQTGTGTKFVVDTAPTINGLTVAASSVSAPTSTTSLNINSATANSARTVFSGNGFNAGNSTDGLAFLLFRNDTTERTLGLADSSLLASNSTNPIFRIGVATIANGGPYLDAISTNGTAMALKIQPSGGNSVVGGNFGVSRSAAGTEVTSSVANTNSTAGSLARFRATTANGTGNSPSSIYTISSVIDWSAGVDQADSRYKIDASDTVGLNTKLAINSSGIVSTASGGGIQFGNSTSSYSPSTLNYYEQGVTSTVTTSGAVAQSFTVTFSRNGNHVDACWPDLAWTTSANAALTATAIIPARFRPNSTFNKVYRVLNFGSWGAAVEQNLSNGNMVFYATIAANGFSSGTNTFNIYSDCAGWSIN